MKHPVLHRPAADACRIASKRFRKSTEFWSTCRGRANRMPVRRTRAGRFPRSASRPRSNHGSEMQEGRLQPSTPRNPRLFPGKDKRTPRTPDGLRASRRYRWNRRPTTVQIATRPPGCEKTIRICAQKSGALQNRCSAVSLAVEIRPARCRTEKTCLCVCRRCAAVRPITPNAFARLIVTPVTCNQAAPTR